MSVCAATCATTVPDNDFDACKIEPRKGGISRIVLVACDYDFTDITDLNEWQTAIGADDVHSTGRLKGQLVAGTATTTKLTSCDPEQVTGKVNSMTFIDYNKSATGLDFDFYDAMEETPDKFKLILVDCENDTYGVIDSFAAQTDYIKPEDRKEPAHWAGTITFEGRLPKPVAVAGLDGVLG